MKNHILKSFFSSGLQAISINVFGVIFIAIVAKMLPKEEFGIIQAANAVAMFITTLISFGMEQVVVRRIAASSSSDWAAAAFLFHNFIGSFIAIIITVLLAYIFNNPQGVLYYLPLFFAAQAVIFLVTPLKQFLNAKHIFTPYGIIAIVSNIAKIILAIVLINRELLSIVNAGYILLFCAGVELISLLIYVHAKTSFKFSFKVKAYKKLLKESMPQYLSSIFDSSLSRLDIILLGFIGTSFAATAEYGIAYRAYEVARLPIAIIGPVILNIFARSLSNGNKINDTTKNEITQLYRIEMFVAMFIPLILNILWSPVLNIFFDDKYGSSNSVEFLLLSIGIPLHFFINLMWTITFSARKYKKIATVTMLSAVVNLLLNVLLIKYYGGVGAAMAYLFTTLLQATLYYTMVRRSLMSISLYPFLRFFIIVAISYGATYFIPIHFTIRLIAAIIIYIGISFGSGQIKPSDIKNLKEQFKK